MSGIAMGMGWRARRFVECHRHIYSQPARTVSRLWTNACVRLNSFPVAYVYAEPMNAGDYASYRGVRLLAGLDGVELFGSTTSLSKTMKSLNKSPRSGVQWKAVFVGGGGLLQTCFDQLWEELVQTGIPLIIFGIGVNQCRHLRNATSPKLLRFIGENALYFRVRDLETAQYVQDATGTRPSVGICPAVNYLKSISFSREENPTHLLHAYHDVDLSASRVPLIELRRRLVRIAATLGLRYDETNHINGLTRHLLKQYSRAAIVVSSRLHGCIFSLAFSVPFVALALDEKIPAFIRTHAEDAIILQQGKILEDLTVERIEKAMNQTSNLHILDKKLAENRNAMESALRLLHSTTQE